MPTYSYACKDCGDAFDIQQSFQDEALSVCPQCGGTLRKQFGRVGVVFKGSGFYRTDSRGGRSSSAPSGSGESKSGTASEASSTSGSSSSSATKPSSAPASSGSAPASVAG